ncbi:MAG: hypothetical protein B6V02_02030 [Thermoprotei archaeon ex4572_64]|nr:MAG: hypothetical protein B6V02_02030 [Thermoprotei archaeon ex4572_64]
MRTTYKYLDRTLHIMREFVCAVCGSSKVSSIINGLPYCCSCGSKVIILRMVRFLESLKREGLIPSSIKIPEL